MSNLGRYSILLLTFIIVLEFVGIPTGLSSVLNFFGIDLASSTVGVDNSGFYNELFGAAGILTLVGITGAVVVGFFTKSFDTSLVVAPFIVILGGLLISTFGGVMIYVNDTGADWLIKIVLVVFSGLAIGLLWACVDYFRTGQ